MRFFDRPFVFLVPLYIIGLMLGDLLPFSAFWYFFSFLIVLGLTWWIRVLSTLFAPITGLTVFFFGVVMMQESRNIDAPISSGTHPRIGIVEEAGNSERIWKKVIVRVTKEKTEEDWQDKDQHVLLYSQHPLRNGDVLFFYSDLEPIRNAGNPGEFDAKAYWHSKNIRFIGFLGSEDFRLMDFETPNRVTSFFKETRTYLSSLLSESLPDTEAALARALMLGDKSMLTMETRDAFGNAGAMHVLAISGLHVGIIMYLVFLLLQRFSRWISRRSAVLVTILFLWLFAGVTGWSPSVVRATLMFSLLLLGQQWGRNGNAMNTLFFSALILLLWNPLLLFDIGFQLSYGAMLGIFLFYDRLTSLFRTRFKWLKKAWEGTVIGIAAQMFTIPLVLYHFHQFPNYFWLTNLGILCLAGVILSIGLAFFALHFVPFVKMMLTFLLGWSLYLLVLFIYWVDTLPWAVATGFSLDVWEIVVYVFLMVVLSLFESRTRLRRFAVAFLLLLMVYWQWNRFEATEKSEWIVFNDNSPVIACKYGNQIRAYYVGKEEKAERLVQAYAKVHPGSYTLEALKMGTTLIDLGDKALQLDRRKKGIQIQLNGKSWTIRTRYQKLDESEGTVIDMPYLTSSVGNYNLSNGAFRSEL